MNHDENARPRTLDEAAVELGTTPRVIRAAFNRGEVQGFRIGKYIRILPESIKKKLAGSSEEAAR